MTDLESIRAKAIKEAQEEDELQKVIEEAQNIVKANEQMEKAAQARRIQKLEEENRAMRNLIGKEPTTVIRPSGIGENVRDIKSIRARKEKLSTFLTKWENTKRGAEKTTKPNKRRELEFWYLVEETYYSPNWFGPLRPAIEEILYCDESSGNSKKSVKKTKTEAELQTSETLPLLQVAEENYHEITPFNPQ